MLVSQSLQKQIGGAVADVHGSLQNLANGFSELLRRGVLGKETGGARFQYANRKLIFRVNTQHQHPRLLVIATYLLQQLEPRQSRQIHIETDEIKQPLLHQFARFLAIGGFRKIKVALRPQNLSKAPPNYGM